MKNLKWFGFGHSSEKPGKGDLALFCAACPQKNINVSSAEWEELPDTLKLRSFVADGNFSCVHQKQRASEHDAWITSGTGYVTEKNDYAKHIKATTEAKEVGGCLHLITIVTNILSRNLPVTSTVLSQTNGDL